MIQLSKAAEADLDLINAWARQEYGDQVADRLTEQVLLSIERLIRFPYIGRPGRIDGTRELVIRATAYIAIYQVADGHILISRVIHTARQWPPGIA